MIGDGRPQHEGNAVTKGEPTIAVLDYGMGNLRIVARAIEHAGGRAARHRAERRGPRLGRTRRAGRRPLRRVHAQSPRARARRRREGLRGEREAGVRGVRRDAGPVRGQRGGIPTSPASDCSKASRAACPTTSRCRTWDGTPCELDAGAPVHPRRADRARACTSCTRSRRTSPRRASASTEHGRRFAAAVAQRQPVRDAVPPREVRAAGTADLRGVRPWSRVVIVIPADRPPRRTLRPAVPRRRRGRDRLRRRPGRGRQAVRDRRRPSPARRRPRRRSGRRLEPRHREGHLPQRGDPRPARRRLADAPRDRGGPRRRSGPRDPRDRGGARPRVRRRGRRAASATGSSWRWT